MHVSLNNAMRGGTDVFKLPSEKNAFALRHTFGLNNECPCFALGFSVEIISKFMVLDGKHPSKREEVVLLRKFLSHFHESSSEKVFPG